MLKRFLLKYNIDLKGTSLGGVSFFEGRIALGEVNSVGYIKREFLRQSCLYGSRGLKITL
jgi:hypothetical protein